MMCQYRENWIINCCYCAFGKLDWSLGAQAIPASCHSSKISKLFSHSQELAIDQLDLAFSLFIFKLSANNRQHLPGAMIDW